MADLSPEQVLRNFFNEMHEFQERTERRMGTSAEKSNPKEFWDQVLRDITAIWLKWCASPYGEVPPKGFFRPTEYGDGEVIEKCVITAKSAIVTTRGSNMLLGVDTISTIYKFKLVGDEWRIVSRHDVQTSGRLKKVDL